MENQELILPEQEVVMPLLEDYGITEEEARVYVGILSKNGLTLHIVVYSF